jgi:GIY-YIG catalytic domain
MPAKAKPVVSGIYAIRHKENNKTYVGLSRNIRARWKQHRLVLRNKKPDQLTTTYRDMIADGCIEDFEFTILETCDPHPDILQQREIHWENQLREKQSGLTVRLLLKLQYQGAPLSNSAKPLPPYGALGYNNEERKEKPPQKREKTPI